MIARVLILWAALLAGCVTPLPPTPQDLAAKRFEAAPGKAVIYLVRDNPDFSYDGTTLMLDDNMAGTTYPGTYFRWEVAPGMHRIAGFAGDAGAINLRVEPNALYFVQQSVSRAFHVAAQSSFRPVDPGYGRVAVMRSVLVASQ